ncbi:unnamed protein product [Mytilus coruscus]|uniref:Short-chain collagen C4-like n=1 Tax=Mytilus coruscus TaxID=42192 RepID=A0A6J8A4D8_MYTCO|nr:unnamed protein product [Mytilus coruscus]
MTMSSVYVFIVFLLLLAQTKPTVCKTNSACTDNMDSMMFQVIWAGLKSLKHEPNNQNNGGKATGGSNYIQWGRSTCTNRNSELVYDGYTGGSSHTKEGSAVNDLCLPKQPQWGVYDAKVNNNPFVGAAVFNVYDIDIKNSLFDKSKYDMYSFPCAVCHTKIGSSILMIPGRKDCIGDWNKEYTGYLMSGFPDHKSATEYICVDADSERLKKASSWTNKRILYAVAAKCNGVLPCPPYVDGREMTCVVCSK